MVAKLRLICYFQRNNLPKMRAKLRHTTLITLFLASTSTLFAQKLIEKLGFYVAPGVAFIPGKETFTPSFASKNAFGSYKAGLSLNVCLLYYSSDKLTIGLDAQYFFASKSQHKLYNTSLGPILKYNLTSSLNTVSPFVIGGPRLGYTYLSRSEYFLSETPESSDTKHVDIQKLDLHFGYSKFGIMCFGIMAGAGIDIKVNKRLKMVVMASYTYQFEKGSKNLKDNFPENKSNLIFITGEVGFNYQLFKSKSKKANAVVAEHKRHETMKNIAHGAAKKDPHHVPAPAPGSTMKLKAISKEGLDPNKKYVVNGQVEGEGKKTDDLSILILDEKGKVVGQAKTDKKGRFAYKGLKPDNYTVALAKNDPSLKASANVSPEDPTMKVDASAMNKFAFNRLSTGDKPAGVVVGDAKLSSDGKAAVDETMLLVDGKGNVVASTKTDKNGKFAFKNLKSDNYEVVSAANPDVKADIKASSGDPNLQIDENDFKHFQFKKLANGQSPQPFITGKINTNGVAKDVSDQTILLLDKNGNVVDQTTASKDGRFAFKGLKPDNYQAVLASGDPNVTAKAHLSSTDPSLQAPESSFFKFDKLGNPGTPEKLITGKVDLTAHQQNAGDATVLLVDDKGNVVDATKLGKDGNFAFKNVRAASYQVIVEGADYDKMVFDVSKNDKESSSLSSGAFAGYGFNKLNPDGSPQNVVLGKVDLGGQELPLNGVDVLLLDESGKVVERANADKEGNFAFRNVKAANYQAVVEGQDYKKVSMGVSGGENSPKVSLADFSKHFNKISPDANNHMVAGQITSNAGQKTATDQTVFLIDGKGDVVGKTIVKKDGSFTFDGLKADNYQTVLEKPDPTLKANLAPVIKDPEMKVSLNDVLKYNPETKQMERLSQDDNIIITGTIRSDDFMAVENRAILLLDDNGQIVKEVYSDKSGVFKFGGIKAKDYQVAYQDGDKKVNPSMQMYKDNDPAVTEQGGKIAKTLYYDHNQTELTPKDKQELEKFVQYYREHPTMKMVKLNAYGDATGTDEANLHITQKRAQLVMEYLKKQGIPDDKVKLNPMGKSLKFKNKYNKPDGKLNRKVDIEIVE